MTAPDISFNHEEKEWLWTAVWNLIVDREKAKIGTKNEEMFLQNLYQKLDNHLYPKQP